VRSPGLTILSLLLAFAACRCPGEAPTAHGFVPPSDSVQLPIADRPWAAQAPDEGWCGEASIQMVALHFGAWFPQEAINKAGKPKHPDLWEDEIPVALSELGLQYIQWIPRSATRAHRGTSSWRGSSRACAGPPGDRRRQDLPDRAPGMGRRSPDARRRLLAERLVFNTNAGRSSSGSL